MQVDVNQTSTHTWVLDTLDTSVKACSHTLIPLIEGILLYIFGLSSRQPQPEVVLAETPPLAVSKSAATLSLEDSRPADPPHSATQSRYTNGDDVAAYLPEETDYFFASSLKSTILGLAQVSEISVWRR